MNLSPSTELSAPGANAAQMARAVLEMLGAARQTLGSDPGQALALVDRAAAVLKPLSLDVKAAANVAAGGLAPWQVRKVTRHVAENLDRTIGNDELAALVRLSVSHFGRAFKCALGLSPREYVIQSRIDRAKALMTRPELALSQIALDCGFCDQSHLSRTFHQVVGITPNSWRRVALPELAA